MRSSAVIACRRKNVKITTYNIIYERHLIIVIILDTGQRLKPSLVTLSVYKDSPLVYLT